MACQFPRDGCGVKGSGPVDSCGGWGGCGCQYGLRAQKPLLPTMIAGEQSSTLANSQSQVMTPLPSSWTAHHGSSP